MAQFVQFLAVGNSGGLNRSIGTQSIYVSTIAQSNILCSWRHICQAKSESQTPLKNDAKNFSVGNYRDWGDKESKGTAEPIDQIVEENDSWNDSLYDYWSN
mgnify:CR=1 FL=1